ncbi:hypothetical protein K402DRAFT_406051 [Aulographum hederae CBS 113979]|uniref:PHD-type domain-containing protein n=1 Tax=Aulographum hederae CBS 113979 TaxID=1176131 RepID=A0A6G1GUD6_9PEZI|nr:hypothetical protein K402DRAFT_406051 [Aulographum hederae CBS 113979]
MLSRRATARKSSRTSSPFVRHADSPAVQSEARKEMGPSDTWVEPPLRVPVPSFEDHGFERGGVLEHMAPLGVPPSSKLKARIENELKRKTNGGRISVVQSVEREEEDETSDSPFAAEPEASERVRVEQDPLPSLPVNKEEARDDDYLPNGTGTKSSSRAPKPQPHSHPNPPRNGSTVNSSRRASSTTTPVTTPKMHTNKNKMGTPTNKSEWESTIKSVIGFAEKKNNPSLGYAVKHLYIESATDPRIANILKSIIQQTADDNTVREFQHLVKRAKKFVKGTDNAPTPAPRQGGSHSQPPIVPPAASIRTQQANTTMPSTMTTSANNGTIAFRPTIAAPFASSHPSSESTPLQNSLSSIPFSSDTKQSATNGMPTIAHPTFKPINAVSKSAQSEAASRSHRSSSIASSSSSLSSVDEERLEEGRQALEQQKIDAPQQPTEDSSTMPVTTRGSKPDDGKKKERNLSLYPDPSLLTKKKGRNAHDSESSDQRIAAAEDALIDMHSVSLGDHHMRDRAVFGKKMKPDERSSRARAREAKDVIPPVVGPLRDPRVANHPGPTTGRVTRKAKRALSQIEGEQTETQEDSNGEGGPVEPPRKKAKRSKNADTTPVNRTGALTAGNPRETEEPSDAAMDNNDDFCSSCGGRGTLVCCDSCKCSFHLLCLQPPREENFPGELWACDNCTQHVPARAAKDDGLFGALDANIKGINPRAFKLPQDIRDYYKYVSTAPSGEYVGRANRRDIVQVGTRPRNADKDKDKSKDQGKGKGKSKDKNQAGDVEDETPDDYVDYQDIYKTQNSKGVLLTCAFCKATANPEQGGTYRCDVPECGLLWHRDCAGESHIWRVTNKRSRWICPRHASNALDGCFHVSWEKCGHLMPPGKKMWRQWRKPKVETSAPVRQVLIPNNNGNIDVMLEPESSFSTTTLLDENHKWSSMTVPEKGVYLDFIRQSKQKQQMAAYNRSFDQYEQCRTAYQNAGNAGTLGAVTGGNFVNRDPMEIDAASSLLQMARERATSTLPTYGIASQQQPNVNERVDASTRSQSWWSF